MLNFKILSLPLLFLSFVCCAGNNNSSRGVSNTSYAAVSGKSSLEVIDHISPMKQYKVGEIIEIELTLKDGIEADSVVLFVGDSRKELNDNKYSFVSDASMSLGNTEFSFEVYSGGEKQTRLGSYILLPTQNPIAYGYKVEQSYPHNEDHYTQGLIFAQGTLYEGTGMNGESMLAQVDLLSGKKVRSTNLDDKYFGEGITLLDGKIYQLTWQAEKAFVYDINTFELIKELSYKGEGWGLTTDGSVLYMSNGSNKITVRDPEDFSILRTIEVYTPNGQLSYLNELEWIEGEIWANVYTRDVVARIDPSTGLVKGYIDFTGILPESARTPRSEVFNGIAYDSRSKSIYVTGKYWSKLFEVSIYKK